MFWWSVVRKKVVGMSPLEGKDFFSIGGIEAVFELSTFQPEKSLHKKKPNSWDLCLLNEETKTKSESKWLNVSTKLPASDSQVLFHDPLWLVQSPAKSCQ